jgi:flagellar FliL protein
MSSPEIIEEVRGGAKAVKPKSKKKLIIIGAAAGVVLLGGGGGAAFMLSGGSAKAETAEAGHAKTEEKAAEGDSGGEAASRQGCLCRRARVHGEPAFARRRRRAS